MSGMRLIIFVVDRSSQWRRSSTRWMRCCLRWTRCPARAGCRRRFRSTRQTASPIPSPSQDQRWVPKPTPSPSQDPWWVPEPNSSPSKEPRWVPEPKYNPLPGSEVNTWAQFRVPSWYRFSKLSHKKIRRYPSHTLIFSVATIIILEF